MQKRQFREVDLPRTGDSLTLNSSLDHNAQSHLSEVGVDTARSMRTLPGGFFEPPPPASAIAAAAPPPTRIPAISHLVPLESPSVAAVNVHRLYAKHRSDTSWLTCAALDGARYHDLVAYKPMRVFAGQNILHIFVSRQIVGAIFKGHQADAVELGWVRPVLHGKRHGPSRMHIRQHDAVLAGDSEAATQRGDLDWSFRP